jgi:hypothetical protein
MLSTKSAVDCCQTTIATVNCVHACSFNVLRCAHIIIVASLCLCLCINCTVHVGQYNIQFNHTSFRAASKWPNCLCLVQPYNHSATSRKAMHQPYVRTTSALPVWSRPLLDLETVFYTQQSRIRRASVYIGLQIAFISLHWDNHLMYGALLVGRRLWPIKQSTGTDRL